MKILETGGITHMELIPGGTAGWYYGISYEHGDLYEAEEIFKDGREVEGRKLCLIRYPEGTVYWPILKTPGTYAGEPVYYDGYIYLLVVDFRQALIRILRFSCTDFHIETVTEIPLKDIPDCYNLRLTVSPPTLTRQGPDGSFDIIWPERSSFCIDVHDSFFVRESDRLFFSRWHEEGEGEKYRYWEETVIRNLSGEETAMLPGDVKRMPDGELWHLY